MAALSGQTGDKFVEVAEAVIINVVLHRICNVCTDGSGCLVRHAAFLEELVHSALFDEHHSRSWGIAEKCTLWLLAHQGKVGTVEEVGRVTAHRMVHHRSDGFADWQIDCRIITLRRSDVGMVGIRQSVVLLDVLQLKARHLDDIRRNGHILHVRSDIC